MNNYNEYDYKVALHETGHFIFFIRALIQIFGRKRARNLIIDNKRIYIRMEKRMSSTGKRDAFFKCEDDDLDSFIRLHYSELFIYMAGGLAVDFKTGRKNKKTIEESVFQTLREYEKMFFENSHEFARLPKHDVKNAMVALLNAGKWRGSRETHNLIHELKESISAKEWMIMCDIADHIMVGLINEGSIELDLQKWAKHLL